jgi:mono/diheme cytochrome c family protein
MNATARSRSPSRVLWRLLGAIVAVAVIYGLWIVLGPAPMQFAGGERVALADYHAANPTGVPASLAGAGIIERGEYLARAADCEACHTSKDGASYAGGLPFVLPFGTLYSTNITPDKETGIGTYSDDDFLRAMHKGIAKDGARLYPAMPYASYSYMTDADALAIKAYLLSLPPVHAPAPQNSLAFPFNQRGLMAVWSAFFNPDKRFEPNTARSPEWNRGAYLAEAMAHCGECHTPRNLAEALDNRRKFAGAIQAGWRAYNVTADKDTGIGAWTDPELARYLASAHAEGRGSAAGPMGEAVDKSLKYLVAADIAAIVEYVRSVPAIASPDLPAPRSTPAPESHAQGVAVDVNPLGKAIFEGDCVSCHSWTGAGSLTQVATLIGSRAVNDPTATNVAQIVLSGADAHTDAGSLYMPAFGRSLSDLEVAAVANYVTARFGAKPSSVTAQDVKKMRQSQ